MVEVIKEVREENVVIMFMCEKVLE